MDVLEHVLRNVIVRELRTHLCFGARRGRSIAGIALVGQPHRLRLEVEGLALQLHDELADFAWIQYVYSVFGRRRRRSVMAAYAIGVV